MKKLLSLVLCLVLVLALAVPAHAALSVSPTRQKLSVDGKSVTCEIYAISTGGNGNNYFKLRDVAYMLRGTGSQFSVEYDEKTDTVVIVTGRAYTPIGDELTVRPDQSANTAPSRQSVSVNGKKVSVSAYAIGGYNFFKLRDLGRELGFDVDYDPATDTMLVRSRAAQAQTGVPAATGARLGQTADAGREYLDRIVFLGDSTTYGFIAYYNAGYTSLPKPANVWTPKVGYLTLPYYQSAKVYLRGTGEELSIAEAAAKVKPEIMVITLGVDGIALVGKDDFIAVYKQLIGEIQTASPDTRIILNSIYPVADSYKYQKDINNDKVNAANGWIESIAVELGLPYLFSWEALAVNGKLPETAHNGDGLHLTGESLGKIAQYVRTHAIG